MLDGWIAGALILLLLATTAGASIASLQWLTRQSRVNTARFQQNMLQTRDLQSSQQRDSFVIQRRLKSIQRVVDEIAESSGVPIPGDGGNGGGNGGGGGTSSGPFVYNSVNLQSIAAIETVNNGPALSKSISIGGRSGDIDVIGDQTLAMVFFNSSFDTPVTVTTMVYTFSNGFQLPTSTFSDMLGGPLQVKNGTVVYVVTFEPDDFPPEAAIIAQSKVMTTFLYATGINVNLNIAVGPRERLWILRWIGGSAL